MPFFVDEEESVRTELWNGHPIRFVEREGEWWAVAKDVCDALEIVNPNTSLASFPESEVMQIRIAICDLRTAEVTSGRKTKARKTQDMLCVSEPGLYRLIFQSRKPEAEAFKTWVFGVIKSIREALGYEQYQAMSFAESARNHHLNMDRLKEALRPSDKVPYVKAQSIANKCMANIVGEAKAIGKDELKARYPEMLPLRDEVLTETVELMALNDKYSLGLSVSNVIYGKFGASADTAA